MKKILVIATLAGVLSSMALGAGYATNCYEEKTIYNMLDPKKTKTFYPACIEGKYGYIDKEGNPRSFVARNQKEPVTYCKCENGKMSLYNDESLIR